MAKVYVNWDEHQVISAKELKEKIDERVQDYRTQSNFEDFVDEKYYASEIFNMVEENGFDYVKSELQGEWEADIRADAEKNIFEDWVLFDTNEDWD